jgi:hypothetical protein
MSRAADESGLTHVSAACETASGDCETAGGCPPNPPSPFPPPPSPLRPLLDLCWLCLRALGSLQLAVLLIAVYFAVLVVATALEGRYDAETARSNVYRTNWFAAIHIVLAVNLLSAMLVRLPWRRRHIGFLIAHGGILVLLIGCGLTWWKGLEGQLSVYEGHANHVLLIDNGRLVEKEGDEPGFQVYLHQFRRQLDPGSNAPSHYSSRVDFLDRSRPPKKLWKDVLIAMNRPVDFTDPQTGRTYRLFQSNFKGPWTPGEAEFDELVGKDRSRDEVYRSDLSVNYDPGRELKYAGSFLIVLGIGLVYYLKGGRRKAEGGAVGQPLAASQPPPSKKLLPTLLLGIVFLSSIAAARADNSQLDWTTWRRLPTFAEGRVMPLDTFARECVTAICGQANPILREPDEPADAEPRTYSAAELLFVWLAEPEKWDRIPFLPASADLREFLGLPLKDSKGRLLRGVSPFELDNCELLTQRLDDTARRADAEGKDFQPTLMDRALSRAYDAYAKYRMLTLTPKSPQRLLWWSNARAGQVYAALERLHNSVPFAKDVAKDPPLRDACKRMIDSWQDLLNAMHGGRLSREKMEPAVAALTRSTERLATRLATSDDAAIAAMGANLHHQATELLLAFYGTGNVLRLVPALDTGALEENRTPDDDASPWLSFQAIIYGSDDLLAAYPQPPLETVRKAFSQAKTVYLDRSAADRTGKFSVAMDRFATSLRSLAGEIEPLRQQLPIRHRNQELIDLTAYPRPGATNIEVLYNRLNPFFWSWVMSLAATLCLLLAVGRWRKPVFWTGAAVLLTGQALAVMGMAFRGYVTGLVPLTSMFESVESVAIYAALLGLGFALLPMLRPRSAGVSPANCGAGVSPASPSAGGTPAPQGATRMDRVIERRLFALAGAIVGFTAAVLAYYAPASVMHRNIGSVTPILRDNFWLAFHVVTIMASYASAAIAWILANIALGYYLLGHYTARQPPDACGVLADFIYAAVKITVLVLAAGTVLGAFWADYAWGHFWGWDPKEVGALLALLAYLLLLHIRRLGWTGDFGMALAAVFGFTVILWTWYGVNYMMKTGMHSYGSGAGGQWVVIATVAFQWLFLLAAALRRRLEIVQSPLPLGEG